MDDVVIHEVSGGLEWRSLTHALFLLPPLLRIVFVPQGILPLFLTGFRGVHVLERRKV